MKKARIQSAFFGVLMLLFLADDLDATSWLNYKYFTGEFFHIIREIIFSQAKENDPLSKSDDTEVADTLILDVPFSSQAPYGDWGAPYQEACEETSILMLEYFWNQGLLDKVTADLEIIALASWESDHGFAEDTNVTETGKMAEEYYGLKPYTYFDEDVTIENIKKLLSQGYPVIVPAAGRKLGNPHYTPPAPLYHMLVIKGYDDSGFITNDPGSSFGESYKYSFEVLDQAIHDWTGEKTDIESGRRAILVLEEVF